MKIRSALLGMTALFAAACSKESAAPSYGDPIGIRLDEDAKQPSLAVAVAATKGADLTPAVNRKAAEQPGRDARNTGFSLMAGKCFALPHPRV